MNRQHLSTLSAVLAASTVLFCAASVAAPGANRNVRAGVETDRYNGQRNPYQGRYKEKTYRRPRFRA